MKPIEKVKITGILVVVALIGAIPISDYFQRPFLLVAIAGVVGSALLVLLPWTMFSRLVRALVWTLISLWLVNFFVNPMWAVGIAILIPTSIIWGVLELVALIARWREVKTD